MPVHRYITPTYFGGLPVTHDLINVTSGGIGASDGSALVAPKKPAPHPNQGTYFVAFGEDATSQQANRGFKALAENTDFLDDVVHRDLAVPTVTATTTVAGVPAASVVLAGDVFVGVGAANDPRTRAGLVQVLDASGFPLTILNGGTHVPVLVSKIHNGAGFDVIVANTFFNAPTVDFNPSIPIGITYRLAYYTRSRLSQHSVGMLTKFGDGVRDYGTLQAEVRNNLIALQAADVVLAAADASIIARLNTIPARANWKDGVTNPIGTLESVLAKVVTDLTSVSGGHGLGKLTATPVDVAAYVAEDPAITGLVAPFIDQLDTSAGIQLNALHRKLQESLENIELNSFEYHRNPLVGIDVNFPGNHWADIAYSPTLDVYVACSPNYTAVVGSLAGFVQLFYSEDGAASFTDCPGEVDYGTANGDIIASVVWADTLALFVAVGEEGLVTTSVDGKNWLIGQATGTNGGPATTNWRAVVWSSSLSLLVASAGGGEIWSSSDATTWTKRLDLGVNNFEDVVWDSVNGYFVAVGDSGTCYNSPDGITWTDRSGAMSQLGTADINHLAFNPSNGKVVAVGKDGGTLDSRAVWHESADGGITWTRLIDDRINPIVPGADILGLGTLNNEDSQRFVYSSFIYVVAADPSTSQVTVYTTGMDNSVGSLKQRPAVINGRGAEGGFSSPRRNIHRILSTRHGIVMVGFHAPDDTYPDDGNHSDNQPPFVRSKSPTAGEF